MSAHWELTITLSNVNSDRIWGTEVVFLHEGLCESPISFDKEESSHGMEPQLFLVLVVGVMIIQLGKSQDANVCSKDRKREGVDEGGFEMGGVSAYLETMKVAFLGVTTLSGPSPIPDSKEPEQSVATSRR